jgi:drug/metabolite transporter (DMT)-like permease
VTILEGHQVWRSLACPAGATTCDDVSNINATVLLFPLLVPVAFVLALPFTRLVARRRWLGAAIAVLGAIVFLYYGGGSWLGFVVGLAVAIGGLALSMGRRGATDATET